MHWEDVLCAQKDDPNGPSPSPADDEESATTIRLQSRVALESSQSDPADLSKLSAHKFISTMVPTDCEEEPEVSLNLWATSQDLKGMFVCCTGSMLTVYLLTVQTFAAIGVRIYALNPMRNEDIRTNLFNQFKPNMRDFGLGKASLQSCSVASRCRSLNEGMIVVKMTRKL